MVKGCDRVVESFRFEYQCGQKKKKLFIHIKKNPCVIFDIMSTMFSYRVIFPMFSILSLISRIKAFDLT